MKRDKLHFKVELDNVPLLDTEQSMDERNFNNTVGALRLKLFGKK